MPKATIATNTQRYDLETLPEGYVELRQLPYGDWLHRQDIAMSVQLADDSKGKTTGELKAANFAVTQFEFSKCIVDHNLEDDAGQKLDFTRNGLSQLDPRIGNEVGELIRKLHEFDEGN